MTPEVLVRVFTVILLTIPAFLIIYITIKVASKLRRNRSIKRMKELNSFHSGKRVLPQVCMKCGSKQGLERFPYEFKYINALGAVAATLGVHYEKCYELKLPFCKPCRGKIAIARWWPAVLLAGLVFVGLVGTYNFLIASIGIPVSAIAAMYMTARSRVAVLLVDSRNLIIDTPGIGAHPLIENCQLVEGAQQHKRVPANARSSNK